MGERLVIPTANHRAYRDDLLALLKKHTGDLDCSEMLAMAAHLTGQILALQDQRTMTPERAMQIVTRNIEQGNQEAINNLMGAVGNG